MLVSASPRCNSARSQWRDRTWRAGLLVRLGRAEVGLTFFASSATSGSGYFAFTSPMSLWARASVAVERSRVLGLLGGEAELRRRRIVARVDADADGAVLPGLRESLVGERRLRGLVVLRAVLREDDEDRRALAALLRGVIDA